MNEKFDFLFKNKTFDGVKTIYFTESFSNHLLNSNSVIIISELHSIRLKFKI